MLNGAVRVAGLARSCVKEIREVKKKKSDMNIVLSKDNYFVLAQSSDTLYTKIRFPFVFSF